jgi:uncharacterized protein involved in response to NO
VRADRTRIAVVGLIIGVDVVIAGAFYTAANEWTGLEELGTTVFGTGIAILVAWTLWLARGLWRGRRWAQVASLVTFGAMAAGALYSSIDVVRRIEMQTAQPPPKTHFLAPALITILSGIIAMLVSSMAGRETEAIRPKAIRPKAIRKD